MARAQVKLRVIACVLAVVALGAGGVHAEEKLVGSRAVVRLRLAAPDAPAVEARYDAVVEVEHYQTGRHASRLHPIDDRQCRWSAVAYVQRDLCAVADATACDKTKSRRFAVSGPAPSPTQSAFGSPNCSISQDAFALRLAALRQNASAAVSGAIAADQDWLKHNVGGGHVIAEFIPVDAPTQPPMERASRAVGGALSFAEASR